MVTEDELAMIMKLRANGLNHQEIADKLQIPRSTIAYQLSKLKESASIETPLKIIEAQGFEANQTTVSFTPHDFENNRTSLTLYVSGNDVFEIKEGLIHKTTMPTNLGFRGKDYGELASIIGAKPNWFQVPDFRNLRHSFDTTYRSPLKAPSNVQNRHLDSPLARHMFHEKWNSLYRKKFDHVAIKLFGNVPKDKAGQVKYIAKMSSNYDQYITEESTELSELRKTVKLSNGKIVPQLVIAWFELNGIAEEDVSFCMDSNVSDSKTLDRLRIAGCANTGQLDELAKSPYDQWDDYQLAIKYHRLLYPHQPQPTRHSNQRQQRQQRQQTPQSSKFITAIQLNKIVQEGWSEQEMAKAIKLGFNPLNNTKEVYEQMPNRLNRLGLRMDKVTMEWASTVDLSAYEGFSSPRAAVLFGIIQMSATNTLRLDSLLSTYNSATEPGANIANVKQLHDQVLSRKPFIDICMSDPVSGMVEKTSGDSYVPKPQVVVVEKIVEVTPSVTPLLPISNYNHLMTSKEALESKLRDAINRQDLADSNTRAWIRFETHSKSILKKNGIEIPKDEPNFNVKLVDQITSFLSLSEPQCKLLHQSRMIRNDENHPEDPSGITLKLTHVGSLLEITERIV